MKKSLISINQISHNLRRAIQKNCCSLLIKEQFEELALKHYGVYENGELIGYICPYSGEILTDFKDVVLEHIIPISSGGGTILFNCIPTSSKVNDFNEKGAKHLLTWWTQKDYYSPEKLQKLLLYIFDAYDIVFKKNKINETNNLNKNMYYEIDYLRQADLSYTSSQQAQMLKMQEIKTGFISYLGFINDCILELKNHNFDTSIFEQKIKQLENDKVFTEIDRYISFQNALKQIIKNKYGIDNRLELTYTLNINIARLMHSMSELNNLEDIYEEILKRFNNIQMILKQNNIGIISFFEDIQIHEILYKRTQDITENDINKLLNDINLSVEDRFKRLINLVEHNNGRLLNSEEDKNIAIFVGQLKHIDSNRYFNISLDMNQLTTLKESKYQYLRNIYEEIYLKSLLYDIKVKIKDDELNLQYSNKDAILKRLCELKKFNKTDVYNDMHINALERESILFQEFIEFVNINDGNLPKANSDNKSEIKIATFKQNIRQIKKTVNGYSLGSYLTYNQMMYLKKSQYINLKLIYEEIYLKSKLFEIEISVVSDNDLDIKYSNNQKLEERLNEIKNILNSDARSEIKNQRLNNGSNNFYLFIEYIKDNNGSIPEKNSEKYLQSMDSFSKNIRTKRKTRNNFTTILNEEQLLILKNSEYDLLHLIYEEIYLKSKLYGIKIAIEKDEELDKSFPTFEDINKRLEEIKSNNRQKGINNMVNNRQNRGANQFNDLLDYVSKHDGMLPKKSENKLGLFLQNIKTINKKTNNFGTLLSNEQLIILKTSEYENLRLLYEQIYIKSLMYNISLPIEKDIIIESQYPNVDSITQRLEEIKKIMLKQNKKGKVA